MEGGFSPIMFSVGIKFPQIHQVDYYMIINRALIMLRITSRNHIQFDCFSSSCYLYYETGLIFCMAPHTRCPKVTHKIGLVTSGIRCIVSIAYDSCCDKVLMNDVYKHRNQIA